VRNALHVAFLVQSLEYCATAIGLFGASLTSLLSKATDVFRTRLRRRKMKITAVVTTLLCSSRQVVCLPSTGTATQVDHQSFAGAGDLRGVPQSNPRITTTNILCLPSSAEAGIPSASSRPLMASRQTCSPMRGSSRLLTNGDGNVIRFRPRSTPPRCELSLASFDMTSDSPVADLRKYEHATESDDDYRHRMRVNCLAAVVVIVLTVAGSWMVDTIINSWPR
jgi:hypothetical protein